MANNNRQIDNSRSNPHSSSATQRFHSKGSPRLKRIIIVGTVIFVISVAIVLTVTLLYFRLRESPSQTTTAPDMTDSIVISNAKDNEIISINGVNIFGIKDYSGNVQSIYAIQTGNAIYSMAQDRIIQIQTDNQALIFKYNDTNNQFMASVTTQNSSYEIPTVYKTPNITFPKPVFVSKPNTDLPNPYTGIVFNLEDIVTSRPITDATLRMYYYDDQLGNRSIVMQNIGGGSYYSLLPTNDTDIDNYFNRSNLISTIPQQSISLLELMRTYPIVNICAQAPETVKQFCSIIIDDMTTTIPNGLDASSKYAAQIPLQSNSPGELYDFRIVAFIPGEQPITIFLDSTGQITTNSLSVRANSGFKIDPNTLTAFLHKVVGARGKCNEQTVAGNDIPDDRIIDIGKAHTTIRFYYETYWVKDQIDVYYKNQLAFSSGCIGTNGQRSTTVVLDDNESSLRVNVIPNCAGETDTAWYYTIECAFQEMICSDNLCYCGASKRPSTQINQGLSDGCGSENSWFASDIREKGDELKFTPYCNVHDECYGTCNLNRAQCDQQFLRDMRNSCPTNWINATDIQNCIKWADLFYTAVYLLGSGPFEEAQKASCSCS